MRRCSLLFLLSFLWLWPLELLARSRFEREVLLLLGGSAFVLGLFFLFFFLLSLQLFWVFFWPKSVQMGVELLRRQKMRQVVLGVLSCLSGLFFFAFLVRLSEPLALLWLIFLGLLVVQGLACASIHIGSCLRPRESEWAKLWAGWFTLFGLLGIPLLGWAMFLFYLLGGFGSAILALFVPPFPHHEE